MLLLWVLKDLMIQSLQDHQVLLLNLALISEESKEVSISEVTFLEFLNTAMVLEVSTTVLVLRIEISFNKTMLSSNTF